MTSGLETKRRMASAAKAQAEKAAEVAKMAEDDAKRAVDAAKAAEAEVETAEEFEKDRLKKIVEKRAEEKMEKETPGNDFEEVKSKKTKKDERRALKEQAAKQGVATPIVDTMTRHGLRLWSDSDDEEDYPSVPSMSHEKRFALRSRQRPDEPIRHDFVVGRVLKKYTNKMPEEVLKSVVGTVVRETDNHKWQVWAQAEIHALRQENALLRGFARCDAAYQAYHERERDHATPENVAPYTLQPRNILRGGQQQPNPRHPFNMGRDLGQWLRREGLLNDKASQWYRAHEDEDSPLFLFHPLGNVQPHGYFDGIATELRPLLNAAKKAGR